MDADTSSDDDGLSSWFSRHARNLAEGAAGVGLSLLDGAIKADKAVVDVANMLSGGRLQAASDFFNRGTEAADWFKPDSVRRRSVHHKRVQRR